MTPMGKLTHNIRKNIYVSLKGSKNRHEWEMLVGYTVDALRSHLEKQFSPSMTWDNYGSFWHIDHKIPVAAFNFEKPDDLDFKRCWDLKNLQPLEAIQNMKKGHRLCNPFQPALKIAV